MVFFDKLISFFRRPKYKNKVFCIGYNKTGTTSFGAGMKVLGYRNASFNKKVWREYYLKGDLKKVIRFASKYDSFDDLPWLLEDLIPVLDLEFPESKFVYLERNEADWLSSLRRWKKNVKNEEINDVLELSRFREHRKFILEYFKGRNGEDFLILDISDELGLMKLARFLGVQAPQSAFPKLNVSRGRQDG
ncbi:MAG: hypothetical protein GYB31_14100 [Bacteroidetes bacterium]|nr:hypothetical protein [Bacteroidota bacterium]